MKSYNEENARDMIDSLVQHGRKNIILSNDMSKIEYSGICRFFVDDGNLWLSNEYGMTASKHEILQIIEYLHNSIEVIDEEQSIKDEIQSLYDEIDKHRNVKKEPPKPAKDGYVYLMEGENGRFKIGFSGDPLRRQKELCLSSCEKHELIHSFYSKKPKSDEKKLHDMFSDLNTHTEWFSLSDKDVKYIKSLRGDSI